MDGLIVLDKPAGISSAQAVARVKRLLPRGTKIGHAGTLDPFATGVLILLVGKATKRCESLMSQPKEYDATVNLGATTPTDDPDSPEVVKENIEPVARETIEGALRRFVGEIQQKPPAYSALHVGGQRAYDIARRGQRVDLPPRTVQIHSIELLSYDWPLLRLRINCGRGTYIRSIARDLGETLNVGGYLIQLRRTRIGDHRIESAATLEQLTADGVGKHLRPPL